MVGGGSDRRGALRLAASLGLALALPALLGASCRARPEDCDHASLERCTWEQAVNDSAADTTELEGGDEHSEDGEGDAGGITMTETEQDELDATLDQMIEIMGSGLEWSLVDEQARALCRVRKDGKLVPAPVTPVTPEDGPDGPKDPATAASVDVWRCSLSWLKINSVELVLEASDGVISLSAEGLAPEPSETVAAFAEARFDDWCASEFEEFEGRGLAVVRRCDLPEGPYLVIARFPRDPDANTWQVSVAVVDAG